MNCWLRPSASGNSKCHPQHLGVIVLTVAQKGMKKLYTVPLCRQSIHYNKFKEIIFLYLDVYHVVASVTYLPGIISYHGLELDKFMHFSNFFLGGGGSGVPPPLLPNVPTSYVYATIT